MIKRRAVVELSVELLGDRLLGGTPLESVGSAEVLEVSINHHTGMASVVLSGEDLPTCAEGYHPVSLYDVDVRSEDD